MTLQRLVLDYRTGELVVRCLYRQSTDSPGPSTKARQQEVTALVRTGMSAPCEVKGVIASEGGGSRWAP